MLDDRVTLTTAKQAIRELFHLIKEPNRRNDGLIALRSSGAWVSIERDFHDAWAEKVDRKYLDPNRFFSSPTAIEFRFARDCLGEVSGRRILDLGCGTGEAAVYFAERNAQVTAADVSFKMVELTCELAAKYGVQNRVLGIEMNSEDLPFPDHYFDFVFGSSVLHHVNLSKTTHEVSRVLTSDGKVVFIEPLAYNPIIEVYRRIAYKVRTRTEYPMSFDDIRGMKTSFSTVRHAEFHLFTLLIFIWFFLGERIHPNADRYWKRFVLSGEKYAWAFNPLHAIDKLVLGHSIHLRKYCWATVIVCSNSQFEQSSNVS
jgi:ubiquinone/menaquinone biosynthesis C-methylase UbiE